MLRDRFSPAQDMRAIVYAKTPKGREEVTLRTAGLNSRQRSTLIMLDGRKRLDAIPALPPQPELDAVIRALLDLELIAPHTTAAVSPPVPAPAAPVDTARLQRIKAMMTESAVACLGLMAADLVRRIQKAGDDAQLQSVLGHWHMAMRESKYGRAVAGERLAQIKACFDYN
jgi:hypothetical protein